MGPLPPNGENGTEKWQPIREFRDIKVGWVWHVVVIKYRVQWAFCMPWVPWNDLGITLAFLYYSTGHWDATSPVSRRWHVDSSLTCSLPILLFNLSQFSYFLPFADRYVSPILGRPAPVTVFFFSLDFNTKTAFHDIPNNRSIAGFLLSHSPRRNWSSYKQTCLKSVSPHWLTYMMLIATIALKFWR